MGFDSAQENSHEPPPTQLHHATEAAVQELLNEHGVGRISQSEVQPSPQLLKVRAWLASEESAKRLVADFLEKDRSLSRHQRQRALLTAIVISALVGAMLSFLFYPAPHWINGNPILTLVIVGIVLYATAAFAVFMLGGNQLAENLRDTGHPASLFVEVVMLVLLFTVLLPLALLLVLALRVINLSGLPGHSDHVAGSTRDRE